MELKYNYVLAYYKLLDRLLLLHDNPYQPPCMPPSRRDLCSSLNYHGFPTRQPESPQPVIAFGDTTLVSSNSSFWREPGLCMYAGM